MMQFKISKIFENYENLKNLWLLIFLTNDRVITSWVHLGQSAKFFVLYVLFFISPNLISWNFQLIRSTPKFTFLFFLSKFIALLKKL